MAKRSKWRHYRLAGSQVCIIVYKRTRDVLAFVGGNIFVLDPAKAEGLAESVKDSCYIGEGLYWTYAGTKHDVTLTLNTPDERIIGEIRVVSCGGGEAEVFTDANCTTSIGTYGGFKLRNALRSLAEELTGVYA